MSVQWDSVDQLIAAFNGQLGDEVEALANGTILDMAEGEHGMEAMELADGWLEQVGMTTEDFEVVEDEPDLDLEDDFEPDDLAFADDGEQIHPDSPAVSEEFRNLESHLGRRLTEAEKVRLVDMIPAQGQIPNFVEKFGKELGSRGRDRDSRRALMSEAVDDHIAARAEEEPSEEKPDPRAGKVDLKTETADQRRERMNAAITEAQGVSEAESPPQVLTPAGNPIGDD